MKSFPPLTVRLHWLMLILFVGVFACIELRVLFAKGSDPREGLKAAHFMLAAALLHHFVRHDDTLQRMLPRLGKAVR